MTRSTSSWPTSQTLVIPICLTLTSTAAAASSAAFTITIPRDVPQQLLSCLLFPVVADPVSFCGQQQPFTAKHSWYILVNLILREIPFLIRFMYFRTPSLSRHTSLELYSFPALSTDAASNAAVHPLLVRLWRSAWEQFLFIRQSDDIHCALGIYFAPSDLVHRRLACLCRKSEN